jgi:hypothetical protein
MKTGTRDDDTKPRRGRPVLEKNEVTSELLVTGEGTMAQIAQLFNTDAKTLPKRMKGVLPKGTRRGYKVYSIREAAGRLVDPGYEIEEFIRQMSPQELPPLLNKEFWNAQNSRLKYEKELGNLWPTEEVVIAVNEFSGAVRMALLLVADGVEREVGITDRQRAIIQRMMDAAIEEMKKKIVEKFKDYHANRATILFSEQPGVTDIDEDWNISAEPDDGEALAEEDDDENLLAAEADEEDDLGI